jgi:NADH pyrophosphatase NudC (nudix superfamily)
MLILRAEAAGLTGIATCAEPSPRGGDRRQLSREFYIHRRADTKAACPSWYDAVVAGSVKSGESYEHAIRRELAEEIRIEGVEPGFLFESRYRTSDVIWFTCVYEVMWNRPIQHQTEEVVWGVFMPAPDLTAKLEQRRFVPAGHQLLRRYLAERDN